MILPGIEPGPFHMSACRSANELPATLLKLGYKARYLKVRQKMLKFISF